MAKRKNRNQYQQVDVIPPACRRCGSTEREGYTNVRHMESYGVTHSGQEYTRIVWRRTACKSCGQHRIDRVFENVKQVRISDNSTAK